MSMTFRSSPDGVSDLCPFTISHYLYVFTLASSIPFFKIILVSQLSVSYDTVVLLTTVQLWPLMFHM